MGRLKEKRRMTNVEWLFKNWDKRIEDCVFNDTVGNIFVHNSCSLINIPCLGDCARCVYKWLQSESNERNNIYFNDIED